MTTTPKKPPVMDPLIDHPDVPVFITDPSFRLPHEDWVLWRQRTEANTGANKFIDALIESGFNLSEQGDVRDFTQRSDDPAQPTTADLPQKNPDESAGSISVFSEGLDKGMYVSITKAQCSIDFQRDCVDIIQAIRKEIEKDQNT